MMTQCVAILGSLLLLAVAGFCVFCFMTTFEPTNNAAQFMLFRVAYAVVGVGCLIGVLFMTMNSIQR